MPTSNPLRRTQRTPQGSIRLAPLGDSAITVEFGDEIDPCINACVVAFTNTVADQGWKGILDIVPTYRSVTIYFDALQWTFPDLAQRLRRVPRQSSDAIRSGGRLHKIPVLYGGEWGPDLEDVAIFAGLSPAETITLHTSVRYQVYMLGFSPGFPYLGFVRERLAMPRLSTPRTKVPAGSVGIADRQTGIYPSSTPGGWRLIGRTPIPLYRKSRSTPFLLKAGDLVQFNSIDQDEFDRLSGESARADD
ncbi:MAG: 5-oxoprolinase subunit PxpB [Nitrospira sp.]|nr:5-oxoprolinase subunit PxpB [Nitrospira sp.]